MTQARSFRRKHEIVAMVAVSAAVVLAGCGGGSSKSSLAGQTATSAAARSATAPSGSSLSTSATIHVGGIVVGIAGGVRAIMHPASHRPRAQQPWPIGFTVTRAGRPARASVSYQFLFGGRVVARRSHHIFTGHFADVFKWPWSSVGYPLTFRAVIASAGVTLDLDYPVRVAG